MDVMRIEPFIEATVGVFKNMFSEMPEYLNPYLLDRNGNDEWDISGIIGIAGDSRGVVVVSLSLELARALTSRLLGTDSKVSEDDIVDAVGEVVNIIAGNAKKGLEEYRLNISLPSIVRGINHSMAWPAGVSVVGIPFRINAGKFHLAVGLENII